MTLHHIRLEWLSSFLLAHDHPVALASFLSFEIVHFLIYATDWYMRTFLYYVYEFDVLTFGDLNAIG